MEIENSQRNSKSNQRKQKKKKKHEEFVLSSEIVCMNCSPIWIHFQIDYSKCQRINDRQIEKKKKKKKNIGRYIYRKINIIVKWDRCKLLLFFMLNRIFNFILRKLSSLVYLVQRLISIFFENDKKTNKKNVKRFRSEMESLN